MRLACLHANGRDIGVRVSVTENANERMRGLLGREALAGNEALLLNRCGSIHTFGMRFPIDILFLNRTQHVVAIHAAVPERRMLFNFRATQTLEMRADSARKHGLAVGDFLAFEASLDTFTL